MINRRWVLASRPESEVEEANFELQEVDIEPLEAGDVLLKVRYLSVNPPMRMALVSGGIAGKPFPLGRTMYGSGLAEVVESKSREFNVGDLVMGDLSWQEYSISKGSRPRKIDKVKKPDGLSETTLMHVMGGSGVTAYIGIVDYCRPRPIDTLVVSTAAGTVGSIVVQLAKLQGCRVIGIAGNDKKCRHVVDVLGADAAINYKEDNLEQSLREYCPDGVNIYFDNVGGETLDTVLSQIAFGARVVLCGGTSQYNNDLDWYGPKNYFNLVYKQAEMHGYYVQNFKHRYDEAYRVLGPLFRDARLSYQEDILDGIESMPRQLIRILKGENFGIPLVRVS